MNFHKKGEIHELFVLSLSLVWFAGATPDINAYNDLGIWAVVWGCAKRMGLVYSVVDFCTGEPEH